MQWLIVGGQWIGQFGKFTEWYRIVLKEGQYHIGLCFRVHSQVKEQIVYDPVNTLEEAKTICQEHYDEFYQIGEYWEKGKRD